MFASTERCSVTVSCITANNGRLGLTSSNLSHKTGPPAHVGAFWRIISGANWQITWRAVQDRPTTKFFSLTFDSSSVILVFCYLALISRYAHCGCTSTTLASVSWLSTTTLSSTCGHLSCQTLTWQWLEW